MALIACDDASSSDDDGAAPAVQFTATATNTTTTRTPNAAYQYVTFDIKSDVEVNVKLVLKEKGQPAPTRQEVLDGAGIYRALKTENKSLFLMYDINSKIKEYREALKASGRNNMNILHDNAATALTVSDTGNDAQNVDALLLKQNTTYTLYALQSDGPGTEEVQALIDLTTREFDSNNLPAAGATFPDLGVPAPNIHYDEASTDNKGIKSTATDLIQYDNRDAALIIPFTAMNIQNILTITFKAIKYTNNDTNSTSTLFQYSASDNFYNYYAANNPILLMYPSFATDGTKSDITYNNVKYQYQYGLVYDYNNIDGFIIQQSRVWVLQPQPIPYDYYGYELQQDQ